MSIIVVIPRGLTPHPYPLLKERAKSLRKDFAMNLHEECLLKYLLNPLDLSHSTELLKINNSLIEKGLTSSKMLAKSGKINYTANRI